MQYEITMNSDKSAWYWRIDCEDGWVWTAEDCKTAYPSAAAAAADAAEALAGWRSGRRSKLSR